MSTDCFVNCSVSDKYDHPPTPAGVLSRRCFITLSITAFVQWPLAAKPIASFSSTEAESLPLYKGITIIHCLITFPGMRELVRVRAAMSTRDCHLAWDATSMLFPPQFPIHGNHIAICFIGKAINRRWVNSATRLHTKFTGSVPQVPM